MNCLSIETDDVEMGEKREEVEMEKLLEAVLECDSTCLGVFDTVGYENDHILL